MLIRIETDISTRQSDVFKPLVESSDDNHNDKDEQEIVTLHKLEPANIGQQLEK